MSLISFEPYKPIPYITPLEQFKVDNFGRYIACLSKQPNTLFERSAYGQVFFGVSGSFLNSKFTIEMDNPVNGFYILIPKFLLEPFKLALADFVSSCSIPELPIIYIDYYVPHGYHLFVVYDPLTDETFINNIHIKDNNDGFTILAVNGIPFDDYIRLTKNK